MGGAGAAPMPRGGVGSPAPGDPGAVGRGGSPRDVLRAGRGGAAPPRARPRAGGGGSRGGQPWRSPPAGRSLGAAYFRPPGQEHPVVPGGPLRHRGAGLPRSRVVDEIPREPSPPRTGRRRLPLRQLGGVQLGIRPSRQRSIRARAPLAGRQSPGRVPALDMGGRRGSRPAAGRGASSRRRGSSERLARRPAWAEFR